MKLLLLSNSTLKGQDYLGWPKTFLKDFLVDVSSVLFIPYAGVTVSYDDYTEAVSKAFKLIGVEVSGIHQHGDMSSAIAQAQSIVIGGGNTFNLLNEIQKHELVFDLKDAILAGTPFIGWSAGSNMVCPTIKTTNDMPIVEPDSFNALNLLPFQINPHYTEETLPNHGGESRAQRLEEFMIKNQHTPVIGLPEGMLLRVENQEVYLEGNGSAKLFQYNKETKVLDPGKLNLA